MIQHSILAQNPRVRRVVNNAKVVGVKNAKAKAKAKGKGKAKDKDKDKDKAMGSVVAQDKAIGLSPKQIPTPTKRRFGEK